MPDRQNPVVFFGLVALALGLPCVSSAHDFWIDPDRFDAEPGAEILLTLRQGANMKGDSLPYLTPLIDDFSRTDSDGRHAIESVMGNDPAAVIIAGPGTTLIGYQSNRDFVELEPDKFDSYLVDEGLESIIDQRQALGESNANAREYFVRCAKLLLDSGAPDTSRVFSNRLGYTLELMPQSDPNKLSAGDELPIELLYLGRPVSGVRVRALTAYWPDQPVDSRTDANGRVLLTLPRTGAWLIKAVHMIRLEDDSKADWESFWASLLFEIE